MKFIELVNAKKDQKSFINLYKMNDYQIMIIVRRDMPYQSVWWRELWHNLIVGTAQWDQSMNRVPPEVHGQARSFAHTPSCGNKL